MHNLCLKGLATGVFLFLFSFAAMAQSISGKVLSGDDKQPLPGATIQVKGTTKKTVTDTNGSFTVAAENSDVLIISNIGFATLQVPASQAAVISLAIDTKGLGEVVVTALGIKKERKKLGYALQEMKGDELTTARETNIVNQLAGKVAGVTVVSSPSGVGGSSRVSIRGERSVDLNKNQPLYVVDGVPISNAINSGSGGNNQEVDFGNGASFINPDDIKSMTVLKGAAAAALYGSRAANGVVMFKTKSGRKQQGLGIDVNSNFTLETPLKLPEYQKVYGQGNSSGGDFAFVNGAGSGLSDGTDEGWGPAYKGQLFPQFNSPRTLNGTAIPYTGGDMNAPAGSVITPTKWEADKDNLKNFLETGRTFTNNVAITGGNDKGDLRVSYTNLDQKGMVPNTDLKRNTTTFSGSYNLTPKFSVKSYVSYIKSESGNRPSISYGTESIMYLFNCWLPSSVKVSDLRRLWQKGLDNKQQYNWNYNYHDNPYMNVYQNTNGQYYDRLIGNVILRYDISSWLNVQLRSATDWSSERREYRRAFSTQRYPYGEYREVNIINEERNTDFLFAADKEINTKFSVNATLGGNQMRQTSRFNESTAGQLNIPDIYRLTNSRIALVANQNNVGKRINSFYGSAGVSYDNKLFLDVTGRNDRSSALTLPEALKSLGTEKNSYFYSSIALSAVISDMIKLPAAISFAKVRASFAQVGNDTDPFAFTQTYNRSDPYGASQVYGETSRLSNLNLKPEISSAYEFGTDLRFLNNRAGIDITYYQSNTKNQILNIPLSNTSGYETRVINAGSIRNSGVEVMLNVTPIQKKHFTWSAYVNFSANRSKVIELSDGLDNYVMADRSVSVEARVGERMGDLYGIGFARVQNTDPAAAYYDKSGKYVGQMVFAANGRPIATTEKIKLGNYNPDWLMGIGNNFSYKGVRLSFLFDIRQGGKLYSHTQTVGREGGIIKETLEGRADGYDMSKPGNGVIGTGAVQNGDGSFSTNTTKVAVREWHSAWTGGRSIAEGVMYNASFVKLRELQIGYSIPGVFGKRLIKGLSVSLVGRNLLLWDHVPHVDPETMSYSGGTALPGIEYMSLPSSRSYGVNLSFKL
ncbi:TonB-linked outer membrane protein, SusC/RagA family [Chitinophaga sp. YR573]|uniref:SusC/RagA family TonB-linked outer membrane protein n=1 Tax=Chitinophaga sp. YR573 TaxID=1881040 RepID=UPI0008AEF3A9|nr:SusC/RagA family TonB-linked outer membrane protein [Chitinophaga sp. YR573]SEW13377.1 TonB-linked outer membrane protein, SusC/RagA family [Chitinophaga sp. YR573]